MPPNNEGKLAAGTGREEAAPAPLAAPPQNEETNEDTFPFRVYEMIEYCDAKDRKTACFCSGEGCFIVENEKRLEEEYLKRYKVCQSQDKDDTPKFQSFHRQLNKYGFRKIKKSKPTKYRHIGNLFRKDKKSLLRNITIVSSERVDSSEANKLCKDDDALKSELASVEKRLGQKIDQRSSQVENKVETGFEDLKSEVLDLKSEVIGLKELLSLVIRNQSNETKDAAMPESASGQRRSTGCKRFRNGREAIQSGFEDDISPNTDQGSSQDSSQTDETVYSAETDTTETTTRANAREEPWHDTRTAGPGESAENQQRIGLTGQELNGNSDEMTAELHQYEPTPIVSPRTTVNLSEAAKLDNEGADSVDETTAAFLQNLLDFDDDGISQAEGAYSALPQSPEHTNPQPMLPTPTKKRRKQKQQGSCSSSSSASISTMTTEATEASLIMDHHRSSREMIARDTDVLCGKGDFRQHAGNQKHRRLVLTRRPSFSRSNAGAKIQISRSIVEEIKRQGGHFLERVPTQSLGTVGREGFWHDIGDKKAMEITTRALEEKRPLDAEDLDDSGDSKQPGNGGEGSGGEGSDFDDDGGGSSQGHRGNGRLGGGSRGMDRTRRGGGSGAGGGGVGTSMGLSSPLWSRLAARGCPPGPHGKGEVTAVRRESKQQKETAEKQSKTTTVQCDAGGGSSDPHDKVVGHEKSSQRWSKADRSGDVSVSNNGQPCARAVPGSMFMGPAAVNDREKPGHYSSPVHPPIGSKALHVAYGADDQFRIAQLVARMRSNDLTLTKIVLRKNDIGKEGAKKFAGAFHFNTAVKHIDWWNSDIGDEGVKVVASALRHNTSLKVLVLGRNSISAIGAKAVADVLPHTVLVSLDLENNNIGANGAIALAEANRRSSTITTLRLGWNNIGDEGAEAIADSLRGNTHITTLYLKRNNISSKGANALADALRHNGALVVLDLGDNNIRVSGAEALASALFQNTSLSTLGLSGNGIGDGGAKAIENALRQNDTVTRVSLNDCNISDKLKNDIQSLLRINESSSGAPLPKDAKVDLLRRVQADERQTFGSRNDITFLSSAPLVWKDDEEKLHGIPASLNFRLERELLTKCLEDSKRDITLSFDVATEGMLRAVAAKRCGCLHFSGRGFPEFLLLDDGTGGAHWLAEEKIYDFVNEDSFKFVFVSACYSRSLGNAFVKAGVRHVVCCEQNADSKDDAALKFIGAFYSQLAKGCAIEISFDKAEVAVSEQFGKVGEDKFMLLPEDGDHHIRIFDAGILERDGEETTHNIVLPNVWHLGREIELYNLLQLVIRCRLVNVVGERVDGNGTLSSVAYQYMREFDTGAIYYVQCGLEETSNDDDASFTKMLQKQLLGEKKIPCLSNGSGTDLVQSVVDALRDSRSLIIFDSVSHVDGLLLTFAKCLFALTSTVKLLLFSREKLDLSSFGIEQESNTFVLPDEATEMEEL